MKIHFCWLEKVDTPSSMQKDDVTQNSDELLSASQTALAQESCVVNEQSCIEINPHISPSKLTDPLPIENHR